MLYIIRHGQTALNSRHVLQGRSDHPLNDTGIRQAQDAARALSERGLIFDRVFASPLIRARQTAAIVAPGVSQTVEQRLIEMDYGPYDGLDMAHLPPEVATFFADFVHAPLPRGMEPLQDITRRTGSFLEEIRTLPGNTLLATHAIAMKGALAYLTPDDPGRWWGTFIPNCAVYAIDNAGGRLRPPAQTLPNEE